MTLEQSGSKRNLKEQINEDFEEIKHIIMLALSSLDIADYLIDENCPEQIMQAKYSPFFQRDITVNLRLSVIELYKLLIKDEKYSLPKLLNKCKKHGDYKDLKIKEDTITEMEALIAGEAAAIEELKTFREKHIGHLDRVRDERYMKKADLRRLINLAMTVTNTIFSQVNGGATYHFEGASPSVLDNCKFIVEAVAEKMQANKFI